MKLLTEHEVKDAVKFHEFKKVLASTLEVGDIVKLDSISGVIGEIYENRLFLWHNTGHCGRANKDPGKETNGEYVNSWCIEKYEMVNAIKLRDIKPLDKKRYLEIIKANLI